MVRDNVLRRRYLQVTFSHKVKMFVRCASSRVVPLLVIRHYHLSQPPGPNLSQPSPAPVARHVMHGMAHDPGEADGTAAAAVGGSGKSTGKRIEI